MLLQVKPLSKREHKDWDALVERSPQGTIFSTSRWLKLFDRDFWIYGVYDEGDRLQGGMVFFDSETSCHSGGVITQFQGILVDNVTMKPVKLLSHTINITEVIIESLEEYKHIEICNHYNLTDIRPFIWNKFKQEVRYTSVVNLSDLSKVWEEMDKDTRNQINLAEKSNLTIKINRGYIDFDRLYAQTFERKGLERTASAQLITKLFKYIDNFLYMVYKDGKPLAGVIIIWDEKRAYYILGASDTNDYGASYMALWSAFSHISEFKNEIDLVGVNNPMISMFKLSFGGDIKPYFVARR
uniref:Putative acetyltransferase n=1 Tax=viral metagenome TaxID=1070528 RepID=A0A6M3IIW2_9ZZZZ